MKVEHYTQTQAQAVEEAPGVSIRWVISDKDGAPNFAMRVFDVAPGGASPYHEHAWEHEVYILQGQGAVKSETGETPFQEGYVVLVKPNEKHQFVNKGAGVMRFICVIPHPAKA